MDNHIEAKNLHRNYVNLALAVVGSSFEDFKAWRRKGRRKGKNDGRRATECGAYHQIMNPNSAMLFWMDCCGEGRLRIQNAMKELGEASPMSNTRRRVKKKSKPLDNIPNRSKIEPSESDPLLQEAGK